MKLIGNLIWIIFGGLETAILWLFVGTIYCISIVGLPLGLQAFKMAQLSLTPFGMKVIRTGSGAHHLLGNIIWFIFGGFILTIAHLFFGILFCITIIGIPFGLQHFKIARLALSPFGVTVR